MSKTRRSTDTARETLTRRDLATALGVHMMTVTKWEREGLPIATRGRRGKPSLYSLAAANAWLQAREEAAANKPVDLIAERARRERAQAILTEQTYAMRAGDLLRKDDVEKAWVAEVTAVRARLLAWPTTLADHLYRVATLDGLSGLERALQEAVHQVLRELSAPTKAIRPRRSTKTATRRRARATTAAAVSDAEAPA